MSLSYRSSSRPSWSSGYGASSATSINRSSSISGGGISSRIPSTVYGNSSLGFSGSSSGRLDYHGLGASGSSCSTSSLGNSVAKPADSYQRRGDSGWRSDISRTGLYPATSSASSFQTARAQDGYVSTGLTRSPRDFTRGSLGSSTVSGNGIDGRRRSSGSSDKMPLPTSPGSDAVFEYSGGARRRSTLGSDVSSDSLLKREETSRFNKRSEKSDECSPLERRASDSKPSSRSSTSSSSSSFRRGRETFRHEDEFSEIKTGVVFQAGPSSVDDSSAPTGSTTNRSTESSGYSSRPVKSEQSQEALKYRNSKSGKSETTLEKDNGRKECCTHPEASTPADKPKRVQRAGFRDRKLKSQLSTGSDCDNEPPASDLMSNVNCTQSEEFNGGRQAKDITNPVDSVSGVFDKKLASYVKDCDTKSKLPSLESGQNLCTHDTEICPNASDGNGASKCSPGFAIKSDKPGEDYVNSEVSSTHGAQGQSLQTRGQTNINRRDDTSVVINTSRTSSSGAKQSQRALGKPATDAGSHVPAGTRKFSTSSPEDISRRPRANGTVKSLSGTPTSAGNRNSTGPSTASISGSLSAQKAEIVRLESLCESRTKELTLAKIQYRDTTRAFDAMSVLVNYCSAELEAFKKQLTNCMAQIAELHQDKSTLDSRLQQACEERDQQADRAKTAEALTEKGIQDHQRLTKEMVVMHDSALTAQRDELTQQHQEAVSALQEQHAKQIERLKQYQERQMNDVRNECKMEMGALRIAHLEEIQKLRNKHDAQMEELHKQHRNKLEDITHRFETIKLTLSEKVESLRGECEELSLRAKNSEEALQRDADVKVQMAIAPFLNLPKEVESLKTVLEMRNEEIQKLRSKNMDLEKQLEEIPIGREKIISLQQKVENLEAIINIKTDHEKQLHEKCQVLMRKYDRESRANKTLSMEHEQILWRMSQSAEFGSSDSLTSLTSSMTSLPGSLSGGGGSSKRHVSRTGGAGGGGERLRHPRAGSSEATSPDTRASPMSKSFHAGEEVQMRVKHNRASSGGALRRSTGGGGRRSADFDSDKKLRSRSATFVVEKGDGDGESSSGSNGSHSLSSSPQAKPQSRRRGRQLSQGNSDWLTSMDEPDGSDITISSNLSQSAGAVIHYELPYQPSARKGDEDRDKGGSPSPVIVAAACTSTPRLDETFEDVSTTTANSTEEEIVIQEEETNNNAMMTASMGSSCTRSISSGVSDSGVYDSMTRSELLNSSMVSTDSEWGMTESSSNCLSNNVSMTLDATVDLDELDMRSGPKARDYNSLNDVTLVPGSVVHGSVGSRDLTSSSALTNNSFAIGLDNSLPTKDSNGSGDGQLLPAYTHQVSVPDDVFDEDMSMESCSFAAGQGQQATFEVNSMTSSTLSIEGGEEEEEEEDEEGGGFSVTCSDTVTDLAGVCSKKSPH